ncbi:MAG TPA: hypothetical protein VHU23_13245 [Rhizomicrobium sp.]|jgi:hypothetical protein|nr:hypothetical protein [Rhizomicrobium sp.]
MSHARRLAALERGYAAQHELTEITIEGGLSNAASFATLLPSGTQLTAAKREWPVNFERRARIAAKETGSQFLILGGLPAAVTS